MRELECVAKQVGEDLRELGRVRVKLCWQIGCDVDREFEATVARHAPETEAAPAAANPGQPFDTKSERFEPSSYVALPCWERDDLGEAAAGMRHGCARSTRCGCGRERVRRRELGW